MAPKAWRRAQISFALVNIPIGVEPLLHDERREVAGRTLCREHTAPVRQQWYCEHGDHVAETVVGYATDDGRWVVPDENDLRSPVDPSIHLRGLVPLRELESAYLKRPYLVWPQTSTVAHSFDLFAAVLAKRKVAAFGTAALTGKERMVIVAPSDLIDGSLLLFMCNFAADMRWKDVEVLREEKATRRKPSRRQVREAETLLVASLAESFEPETIEDTWRTRLLAAIRSASGAVRPAEDDLLAKLRASVEPQ